MAELTKEELDAAMLRATGVFTDHFADDLAIQQQELLLAQEAAAKLQQEYIDSLEAADTAFAAAVAGDPEAVAAYEAASAYTLVTGQSSQAASEALTIQQAATAAAVALPAEIAEQYTTYSVDAAGKETSATSWEGSVLSTAAVASSYAKADIEDLESTTTAEASAAFDEEAAAGETELKAKQAEEALANATATKVTPDEPVVAPQVATEDPVPAEVAPVEEVPAVEETPVDGALEWLESVADEIDPETGKRLGSMTMAEVAALPATGTATAPTDDTDTDTAAPPPTDADIVTSPTTAPDADASAEAAAPEEEVTVTGQDLWANGAKDKDATYYVDEEGGYHKVLADGEEETLSEKQIGQIQAKVTAGATLPDWTQPQDPQAEAATAVVAEPFVLEPMLPYGFESTAAESPDEEEARLKREAADAYKVIEEYANDQAEEEQKDTQATIDKYTEDGVLTSGEELDTFIETKAALEEIREQQEDVAELLDPDRKLGGWVDSNGDGVVDPDEKAGEDFVNLLDEETKKALEEQQVSLQQMEDDILARNSEAEIEAGVQLEKDLIAAGGDPDANAQSQFWTQAPTDYEPKREFRFKVTIPGMALQDALGDDAGDPNALGVNAGDSWNDQQDGTGGNVWYLKTFAKPKLDMIKLDEDFVPQIYGGMGYPEPMVVRNSTFAPIEMTMVDPSYPNATRKLLRILRRAGWGENHSMDIAKRVSKLDNENAAYDKILKETVGTIIIEQFDHNGRVIETWSLYSAFPGAIDFGNLSYASNEFQEIKVTWVYQSFSVDFAAVGAEEAYKYGKDNNMTPTSNDMDHGGTL